MLAVGLRQKGLWRSSGWGRLLLLQLLLLTLRRWKLRSQEGCPLSFLLLDRSSLPPQVGCRGKGGRGGNVKGGGHNPVLRPLDQMDVKSCLSGVLAQVVVDSCQLSSSWRALRALQVGWPSMIPAAQPACVP
jgi:hypothetical protein